MIPEGRILNWTNRALTCPRCHNDGTIYVSSSTVVVQRPKEETSEYVYDADGPCPTCEKGYRIEFALSVKRNQNGVVIDDAYPNPAGGPWGRDGFWRGRRPEDVLDTANAPS
jgi:hypothetical protein